MSFKKSQLESFKHASKITGKPIEDFYNPKTGTIKKAFKDLVKASPKEFKPRVEKIVARCIPLFDQLEAGAIKSESFATQCLAEREKVREEGFTYGHPPKGMPKGLKEYREKSEKVKAEMRKTGIINSE